MSIAKFIAKEICISIEDPCDSCCRIAEKIVEQLHFGVKCGECGATAHFHLASIEMEPERGSLQ